MKALARLRREQAFRRACWVLIGWPVIYEEWNQRIGSRLSFHPLPLLNPKQIQPGRIHILDLASGMLALPVRFAGRTVLNVMPSPSYAIGRVSRRNALLAWSSLRVGTYLASCGVVQGLVTAPVNKDAIRLIEPRFTGHTEYLASVSKTRDVAMMFDGGRLRVTLVSIHVPLARVSASIRTRDVAVKIRLTHRFLRRFYGIRRPRLAVCALNPHGREFGREEDEKIMPAIRSCQRQGIQVTGPHAGDQVFYESYHRRYDAVIAMYHDQGLAPLKTVAFDTAVNITLGLPFIRTSPDHGTAFEIASLNVARETSMLAAMRKALELTSKRA